MPTVTPLPDFCLLSDCGTSFDGCPLNYHGDSGHKEDGGIVPIALLADLLIPKDFVFVTLRGRASLIEQVLAVDSLRGEWRDLCSGDTKAGT